MESSQSFCSASRIAQSLLRGFQSTCSTVLECFGLPAQIESTGEQRVANDSTRVDPKTAVARNETKVGPVDCDLAKPAARNGAGEAQRKPSFSKHHEVGSVAVDLEWAGRKHCGCSALSPFNSLELPDSPLNKPPASEEMLPIAEVLDAITIRIGKDNVPCP